MRRNIVASSLVALASHTAAQVASRCASNDVCFKLNIPDTTAQSGTGDIFFQISAPSSYEWVALGLGERMAGANIFTIYTSSNGQNVTLSPRLVSGYSMPSFNSDAEVSLLEGSGVSGGKMVANVKCSNCHSWNGGSADFSEGDGDWIYAWKSSDGPKNSDDTDARIQQHDQRAAFEWEYASAKGGNSVNPLLNDAGSANPTGTRSCVPRPQATPTPTGDDSDDEDDDDDDDDDDDEYWKGRWTKSGWPTARPTSWGRNDYDKRQEQEINYCDDDDTRIISPIGQSGQMSSQKKMVYAHGALAALAFVVFFPMGAITIRLSSFTGVVWFHAAFQVFGYLVYTAAFGLGVYIANDFDLFNESHPIIGVVIFVALFFMPIFGFLHHALFKKHGTRTFWSYAHLWVGRAAITLGIINGGLGFQLADKMQMGSRSAMIAYAVVGAVMWLAWVAASVVGERRRMKRGGVQSPKYRDREDSGASSTQLRDMRHPEHGHYAPK